MSVFGWDLDFARLRDQLSVFGSEVTTRHHSFFVRGKLMVMQCQWRIALLVIFWGEFKCRIRWSDLCRLLSDISEEYIFTEGSTTRERVTLQKLHKCFLIEPKNEKFQTIINHVKTNLKFLERSKSESFGHLIYIYIYIYLFRILYIHRTSENSLRLLFWQQSLSSDVFTFLSFSKIQSNPVPFSIYWNTSPQREEGEGKF